MDKYIRKIQLLDSSSLKIIACILMLVDHIAFVLWKNYSDLLLTLPYKKIMFYKSLHDCIDKLGDLAFPIFCFLLVEGFQHTKNIWKYLLRIFIFAVISEPVFDLSINNGLVDFSYQNTMFTLFLGLSVISIVNWLFLAESMDITFRSLLMAITIGLGCFLAHFLKMDYDFFGILTITILYFLRFNPILQAFGGIMSFSYKLSATPAFLITLMYNKKRGLRLKYFFYIFYPLHLLLIYLIVTYVFPQSP